MIITIDGFSCLGKSYIGDNISKRLGIEFLSTGKLVRYVAGTFASLQQEISQEETAVTRAVEITEKTEMEEIRNCPWLKKSDTELYLPVVEKYSFVDERLQVVLRKYVEGRDILLDGRYTFLIFPDAYRKYYLQSSVEMRAKLITQKNGMSWEEALSYLSFRDSFEKVVTVPESVRILDPFSAPFGISKDIFLKFLLDDITSKGNGEALF